METIGRGKANVRFRFDGSGACGGGRGCDVRVLKFKRRRRPGFYEAQYPHPTLHFLQFRKLCEAWSSNSRPIIRQAEMMSGLLAGLFPLDGLVPAWV